MNNMQQAAPKKREFFLGDKVLWSVVLILSFFSIFPVYSASSNLEYIVNNGTTTSHLIRHVGFLAMGIAVLRFAIMIRYEYIGKLSSILMWLSVILVAFTSFSGETIDGASASRWMRIPGIGVAFQPSTFAYLFLIIYICRYLTKKNSRERLPVENIIYLFLPVLIVFALVAKDNGSTALMILIVSLLVMLIGQLNRKYILGFIGVAFIAVTAFLLVATQTKLISNNRVDTWISRVQTYSKKDNHIQDEADKAKNYQTMQAKAAIVHGGITGMGPGKSALKQMLPQSASDFIFAIIVEEYGFAGAVLLISLYLIMIIRIMIIASRMPAFFGSLLVLSIGVMIFMQLAVNIAVAVNLIPVTGQPLPLISYGGTSMLVTFFQLGLVLNVSSRIQVHDEEGLGKKQTIEEINDIA